MTLTSTGSEPLFRAVRSVHGTRMLQGYLTAVSRKNTLQAAAVEYNILQGRTPCGTEAPTSLARDTFSPAPTSTCQRRRKFTSVDLSRMFAISGTSRPSTAGGAREPEGTNLALATRTLLEIWMFHAKTTNRSEKKRQGFPPTNIRPHIAHDHAQHHQAFTPDPPKLILTSSRVCIRRPKSGIVS